MLGRLLDLFFNILNGIIAWHRLPKWLGLLNLLKFRNELRAKNLHDTSDGPRTGPPPPPPEDQRHLYERMPDGSYNDLTDPAMGSAGVRFGRNFPLDRSHPETGERLMTPNPREISNRLLARKEFVPATTLNLLACPWIQFMNHDWFFHGEPVEGERLEVPVAEGDWHENPMTVLRSKPDPNPSPSGPPTFVNEVTHWWDASQLYGSDLATQKKIRTFEDGKLILADDGLLPVRDDGIDITGFSDNYWVGLSLLHNLFTREHNAICEHLKGAYASWSDEQLFQTARLVNAALLAKIHTVEWTPGILGHPVLQVAMDANWWGLFGERLTNALGRITSSELLSGIPASGADHHGAPYSITEEFTTVYRLHSLVPDDYQFRSVNNDELVLQATLDEVEGTDTRNIMTSVSFADVVYTFGTSHPGALRLHNYPNGLRKLQRLDNDRVVDMAVVDILRDRERGVPRYNDFRELVHMPRVSSFKQITSNPEWARDLRDVYGHVDRVDMLVGMLAEDLPRGFGFSDTQFRIFILMASRRLKSDRFFTTDFRPEVYSPAGMEWIAKNSMTSVLIRHIPELRAALRGVKNPFAPWNKAA